MSTNPQIDDGTRCKTIVGNAPDEAKQQMAEVLATFRRRNSGFSDAIGGRLRIIEMHVLKKEGNPERLIGKAVSEISIEEDMVNGLDNAHGACLSYLVDLCSTIPIVALMASKNERGVESVTQVLDMVYHSPARDCLQVVSTTLSLGSRAISARSEIWNKTHNRLVATGVITKMDPSLSKL